MFRPICPSSGVKICCYWGNCCFSCCCCYICCSAAISSYNLKSCICFLFDYFSWYCIVASCCTLQSITSICMSTEGSRKLLNQRFNFIYCYLWYFSHIGNLYNVKTTSSASIRSRLCTYNWKSLWLRNICKQYPTVYVHLVLSFLVRKWKHNSVTYF
jgi:hypothetical protein